jgi:hypothetical protein
MDEQKEILQTIGDAWLNLNFLSYQARVAREEFLTALLTGEQSDITQEEMASVCIKGKDHISRSRIAQYLRQARG